MTADLTPPKENTTMSIGQLLTMTPDQRRKVIAGLSLSVRMKLAHLASFGIARELKRLADYEEVLRELTRDDEGDPR